jgi:hypothetical protein
MAFIEKHRAENWPHLKTGRTIKKEVIPIGGMAYP